MLIRWIKLTASTDKIDNPERWGLKKKGVENEINY